MKKNLFFIVFSSIYTLSAISQTNIQLVKDISAGASSSNPIGFYEFNNKMFFSASDPVNGNQIWSSDGTEVGTNMFMVINPTGTNAQSFYNYNNQLVFSADDGIVGKELWISDGTPGGTQLLKDINPTGNSDILGFRTINGKLVFVASEDTHGNEIWTSDGTSSGTYLVKDIFPVPSAYSPIWGFEKLNDKIVFSAKDNIHGVEPWVTDGTLAGTEMLRDIMVSSGLSSEPKNFKEFNGAVYFCTLDVTPGKMTLWKTDGTPAGTDTVKTINVLSGGELKYFTELNGKLYFANVSFIHDPYNIGSELWVTDGTYAGTELVTIISSIGTGMDTKFVKLNNELFFGYNDGIHGTELWKTDGTANGTQIVKDINPGLQGNSDPNLLIQMGDKIYFRTELNDGKTDLYETDGTEAGTIKITPASSTVYKPIKYGFQFYEFKNELYFAAEFGNSGVELYKITDPAFASVKDDENLIDFNIFPNPTNDILTITTDGKAHFILCDLAGKTLKTFDVNQSKEISIIDLNAGIYILKESQSGYQLKVVKF